MLATKALLVFSILVGLVAEECDLGDIAIQEIADKVTVTNTSDSMDAYVTVSFKLSDESRTVRAGQSVTLLALASPSYTVSVSGWGGEYQVYANRLYRLRDSLLELTQTPEASADALTDAWTELALVQSALAQVKGSPFVQSCTAKIETGVTSQVTVKSVLASDNSPIWILDCN